MLIKGFNFTHLCNVELSNELNVSMMTIFLKEYRMRMFDWKCQNNIVVYFILFSFPILKDNRPNSALGPSGRKAVIELCSSFPVVMEFTPLYVCMYVLIRVTYLLTYKMSLYISIT